jgi:hypothetical protein
MCDPELTMSELMHDPMIHQLLRADRVSLVEFALLLQKAAFHQQKNHILRSNQKAATHGNPFLPMAC